MSKKLPEGWKLVETQKIATVLRGSSPRPKGDPRYYGGDVPRLMVADISRDGKYVTPKIDSLTQEGAKRSRPVKKGTLTIVCSGISAGDSAILASDACIHDGLLALVDYSPEVNIEFLYYSFQWREQQLFNDATHGGAYTNLTTTILKEFKFPLPPLLEQRKIAEILSTWDDAIAKTEQIIATLQVRKKGLMQRLLTGEVRFPGYDGEWRNVKVGDLCKTFSGGTPSRTRSNYYGGAIPWIKSGEVNQVLITETDETITEDGLKNSSAKIVEKDTVLLALYGATAGKVGITKIKAATNQAILAVIPDEDQLDKDFLFYELNFQMPKMLRKLQGGQPNLSGKLVKNSLIDIPPLLEQHRIIKILQACDTEISLHERKLAVLQQQKKGLMQRLLTGQVRVRVDKEVGRTSEVRPT